MRFVALLLLAAATGFAADIEKPLFDGKTFHGWEGDTKKTWRIKDGAILGGSLETNVPHNEFLCTERQYTNFVLKLQFKLVGTEGFVNAGVQVRSKRIPNHFEVSGYQCDIGDPTWWGSLYDEARRNKVLAKSDMAKLEKVLKRQDWNSYEIRAEDNRIQAWLNGVHTFDYTEPDEKIPQFGSICLQVHGGGKAEAWYKDISVEILP